MLTNVLDKGYASCWDMTTSPFDGTMYMAPTNENKGVGAHTRLVSYDFLQDKFKICFEAEKLILPHPLQMPHSKLHTSINFLPDGSISATTLTTAGPAHHPECMPLAHIDHVWDGFPGSNILHYDPKAGRAENYGVPVPRESIYGSCYDPKHNCLYMIGFMRGHVYCCLLYTSPPAPRLHHITSSGLQVWSCPHIFYRVSYVFSSLMSGIYGSFPPTREH